MRKLITQCRSRGFSLLEVIAGLAIVGVVAAGTLMQTTSATNKTIGRQAGDSLSSFQQIASTFYQNNRASFDTVVGNSTGAATAAATYCQVNVPSGSSTGTTVANLSQNTCAFDATLLRANNLWPSNVPVEVPGGRYVFVVHGIWSTGSTPAYTGADEVLIVHAAESNGNVQTTGGTGTSATTTAQFKDQMAGSNAALGQNGGYVPPGQSYGTCQFTGSTQQVCGNGWSVTLSTFVN